MIEDSKSVDDFIQVEDRWYVLTSSSYADDRRRVLKEGQTFGVYDRYGDIVSFGGGNQGLYYDGTRFLSRMELTINRVRPLLLNSSVREDNSLLMVDMTTADIFEGGHLTIRKDALHIFRSKHLFDGIQYERLRLMNYGHDRVQFTLRLQCEADYADVFEVRGVHRKQRGDYLTVIREGSELQFAYRGLDEVLRRTRIISDVIPEETTDNILTFELTLDPGSGRALCWAVVCETTSIDRPTMSYVQAVSQSRKNTGECAKAFASVETSNGQFNDWIRRSTADLCMLITRTPQGDYPYAGVPWYSTPFGRDGILTALQTLWARPELARGVLQYLACNQANVENDMQDAEPGKILHEVRSGEMAALHEIPFQRYYGSVDATLLFSILAEAYWTRTGDDDFIQNLWPNVRRALEWIDRYGDKDGDGFVEYARHCADGLINQGWKDSSDAVFHADGQQAKAPIALCEVQAYVYAARRAGAKMAEAFDEPDYARFLEERAAQLRSRFAESFWCEELQSYGLALDADKRLCRVLTSNAGHALFTGIATDEHARRVAETMLKDDMFSGWGIRTVARSAPLYNPMSYHNGSIWPHDNALIALGLAQYDDKASVIKILDALFDASIHMELARLPELFCGFPRRTGQGPTLYPVACAPQAWASGAVFQLIQACLGLHFTKGKPQICLRHPQLPSYIEWMAIRGIRYRNASIDLHFQQHANQVAVNVLRKEGDFNVLILV